MICRSCPSPADVVDEGEEVVGLPVEAEGVQAPEGERRVADPGVAVVPVPFAAAGLRQRRGGRGEQRAGRRVRQALERQRAALQVDAPRVVGELALGDPLPPVLRRAPHPLLRPRRSARRRAAPTRTARRTRSSPSTIRVRACAARPSMPRRRSVVSRRVDVGAPARRRTQLAVARRRRSCQSASRAAVVERRARKSSTGPPSRSRT